jgi:HSP20 family protein
MAIRRWDPFQDFSLMQEKLNRFFDDSIYSASTAEKERSGTFFPPVDILESGKYIILRVELPGVLRENIEIQIEEDVLILRGERRFEKESGHEKYYRMECSYGSFQRSFTLPKSIIKQGIQAQFDKGVLEIRLPKETREKKIQVAVK